MLHQTPPKPTPDVTLRFLQSHHRRGALLTLISTGEVHFEGRARTTSEPSPLLLLLKPDSSLQVQTMTGVKARNWQPRTDSLTFTLEEDILVLTAYRASPPERLTVILSEVLSVQALESRGPAGFALTGSEAQLRAYLQSHPHLIEEGLRVITEELPTGAGDVDLYGRDAQGNFVVVELKRAKATQDAVYQLERYVRTVREELGAGVEVRGILGAPAVTHPARLSLERLGLEFVTVSAVSVLEGLSSQPVLF